MNDLPQPYFPSPNEGALRQGEILTDLREFFIPRLSGNVAKLDEQHHPFVVLVSQDCDLATDYQIRFKKDELDETRILRRLLFCEVTTAESLRVSGATSKAATQGRVKTGQ